MKNFFRVIILSIAGFFFFVSNPALAESNLPKLFIFLGGDNASTYKNILGNPFIFGAQIVYPWRILEPKPGEYDFSKIDKDLNFLAGMHKKLFIQLQDRSFQPDMFNVPDYIRHNPIYHGGVAMQYDRPGNGEPIAEGWAARVWDPKVKERFQQLMRQLAIKYDGKIYGINLPETAVDFDSKNLPQGFTSDAYFQAELDNIAALWSMFRKSVVVQYLNFFPNEWNNDHNYIGRLFSFAMEHNIGLGGPDAVPWKKTQMENSYALFHRYKGKLLTAMAIQEPDYSYINAKTNRGFSFSDFYYFATDYLGASILFWNTQEPFFSKELKPHINSEYFLRSGV